MIDDKTKTELAEIGKRVKALLPDADGNVQFNLSRSHDTPKVNVMVADVTKTKKGRHGPDAT